MLNLLLFAADDAAHGAKAEVFDPAWMPALTAIVVFLLAFGILATQVWPKIVKGLDDREKKIRDEIESAEAARAQANAALEEYEKSLAEAKQEASAMIAKARNDAKTAAEELRASNQAELAEMKQRATAEIQNAKQQAITEIHAEATVLAASIASKILKREINVEDQQSLVNESLEELASSSNA